MLVTSLRRMRRGAAVLQPAWGARDWRSAIGVHAERGGKGRRALHAAQVLGYLPPDPGEGARLLQHQRRHGSPLLFLLSG